MYLKSIELTGFKSFAKKSVLEFSSPISAIVGPNGSGKSNVAEAFRFVLGEQSIKSLRGKKGEDLIFNGAGGEPRGNRASVKVTFDNSSKVFSIDFPEVTLERIVHRDGINDYFINGSAVRLKDIVELLSSAHIGSSGHHIISQGEADRILLSTPKDRKGIIEDALGLKIYQYKRIESERKLKKTFENIGQVESLRREIAPHLKFLEKQVEKVEKAEKMKSELLLVSKEYFFRENDYIENKKKSISEEIQPLQTKLNKLNIDLNSARSILEKAGKDKKEEYAILEIESEIAATRVKKDALSRELGRLEGLISAEEGIIRKEKELLSSNAEKVVKLSEVEKLYEEISTLRAVEEILSRVKSFISSSRVESKSNRLEEAEKNREKNTKDKQLRESSLSELKKTEKDLVTKYESLKKEIETEKDQSRDAEKAVFRIMAEQNELHSRLGLLQSEQARLSVNEAEFKRELDEVSGFVGVEVLDFKNLNVSTEVDRNAQEERKKQITRLKIRLEDAGLSGSAEVLKEYNETSERDSFLSRELEDLRRSADSLKDLIASLEERLKIEFSTGLEKINKEFGDLFSEMFGGGTASLTVVKEKKRKVDVILEGEEVDESDEEDVVTEEGLDISVSLPRKKIRGLLMLSGGERALTSIALLFAISAVNPPPFIILDETDAALDEANSKKYGDLVEKLAKHSQLILITHNRETMSRAGIIYGVTMSSTGVSKLLSIQFEEAVSIAK